jgi:hypothetical protein
MFGPHPDDYGPMATMSDAHSEWHRNTGVPMGQPGCPQDACHPPDDYDEIEAEQALWAEQAPALREGERPAPLANWQSFGPEASHPFVGYDDPPF